MQTIDLTVMGTLPRHKKRKRQTQCHFCNTRFDYVLKEEHQCPGKAAAYASRLCGYEACKEGEGGTRATFKPTGFAAKYCSQMCRDTAQDIGRRASYARAVKKGHHPAPLTDDERHEAEMEPIRKRLAKAARKAAAYVPLMGEALYAATMRLMREEGR